MPADVFYACKLRTKENNPARMYSLPSVPSVVCDTCLAGTKNAWLQKQRMRNLRTNTKRNLFPMSHLISLVSFPSFALKAGHGDARCALNLICRFITIASTHTHTAGDTRTQTDPLVCLKFCFSTSSGLRKQTSDWTQMWKCIRFPSNWLNPIKTGSWDH